MVWGYMYNEYLDIAYFCMAFLYMFSNHKCFVYMLILRMLLLKHLIVLLNQ